LSPPATAGGTDLKVSRVQLKDEQNDDAGAAVLRVSDRPTWRGHILIARPDHWIKNVFALPGVVVALTIDPARIASGDLPRVLVTGAVALCLISSSNYTLNEILDAPFDRYDPVKRERPVPNGRVSIPLAYVQWLGLMLCGLALGLTISVPFTLTLAALWLMGCAYNVPPVRSKDVPYLDVLTEAVNNPLRLLAGWYVTRTRALPPTSLLLSYWMIGCYFMAIKRFAEYRSFAEPHRMRAYRKSFAYYNERNLLVSIMFYGSNAMLFFGAFIMRYRLELILSFPLAAWVMATYLALAFKENSGAQHPERLYREPWLTLAVVTCAAWMLFLLFVDLPRLHQLFAPSHP
ncbi:MAG TPA: UbiA prenyltransferase family protein, partial [Pyrinomonadaceae bacterium]|nr:UbiA prenyltransferase family protein [Pyrinomonadaceae bacterium]